MIINHNMSAINANRQMATNQANTTKSTQKLSSGLRINRAADDAAGLAISEKMRAQVSGLNQATRNAQDGISMIQTAEDALNESHSILQRMREISVQASNGTNTDNDRSALQDELNQLTSEVNRIGNTTEFNTQKLLNGGSISNEESSDKIVDATKATISGTAAGSFTDLTGSTVTATIKVDGTTFDVSEALKVKWDNPTNATVAKAATMEDVVAVLKEVTAGDKKLGDVIDITVSGGKISFESKAAGKDANITIEGNNKAESLLGFAAKALDKNTTASYVGNVSGEDATTQKLGVEGTQLKTDITLTKGSEFKVQLADGSEKTIKLDLKSDKTYEISSTNQQEKEMALKELTKDLNNAIQKAGLSEELSVSISNDNKLQLISESGTDIKVLSGLTTAGITDNSSSKNVQKVVGGSSEGAGFDVQFQIGANTGQSLSITIGDMRASALGIVGNSGQDGFTKEDTVTNGTDSVKNEAALNISSQESATKSISVIDEAITKVSAQRSSLGAVQNRLEHTIKNLGTSSENLTAAESRIRDVDMAEEMMEFTKNNVLSQASQAMLAQAKALPNQVLSLLQ